MSAEATGARESAPLDGWRGRVAQVWATCRYERRRMWRGRNVLGRLILVGLVVVVAGVYSGALLFRADAAFTEPLVVHGNTQVASSELLSFAHVFRFFNLTFVVYFLAMELFGNLFRGELADRTLHHVFLMPLRRQDVVLGKYAAGILTLFALTFGSWLLVLLVVLAPHGPGAVLSTLFSGLGLRHLLGYAVLLLLAAAAYGSVFLLLGLLVRTPLHFGFALWLWERLTLTFLPQWFKRFTIGHWLETFMPVKVVPEGWFLQLGEPEHPLVAAAVLMGLSGLCLALAFRAVRRLEVSYGSD